jgi:hypothetical protein
VNALLVWQGESTAPGKWRYLKGAANRALLCRRLEGWLPSPLHHTQVLTFAATALRSSEILAIQLRVLGFGLLQDGDVEVGVFPEGFSIRVIRNAAPAKFAWAASSVFHQYLYRRSQGIFNG